jgi:hypothetical protein
MAMANKGGGLMPMLGRPKYTMNSKTNRKAGHTANKRYQYGINDTMPQIQQDI